MAAVEQDMAKVAAETMNKIATVIGELGARLRALEAEHSAMRAAYGDVVGEVDKFGAAMDAAINDLKSALGRATALQTPAKA